MKITDMDAFIPVVQKGMECARKCNGDFDKAEKYGWEQKVLYNLKDGRRVYRDIIIPYDIDPALMDKLTGSEEFIKGHAPCFYEGIFTTENLTMANSSLSCSFLGGDESTNNVSVIYDVVEAYKQDVLENYKYSYIRDTSAIGELFLTCEPTLSCNFPVYESFTHVIDVLKKNNLYGGKDYPFDMIKELSVDNYFPGYNFSEMSENEAMELYSKWFYGTREYGFQSKKYTDKDKIKEILDNCTYENYAEWEYPFDKVDKQFNLYFDDKYRDIFECNFVFKKGSVPEFIYEDLNK
jgi:ABC-2 type transport system permease protein